MDATPFRYTTPLRVRYADCDPQGVVFNATYLSYCDVVLTEYMRAIGISYRDYMDAGYDMMLITTTLTYHAPARPDDELTLSCRFCDFANTSWSMEVKILRHDTLLTTATSRYVTVDLQGRKQPTPPLLRDAVARFEA